MSGQLVLTLIQAGGIAVTALLAVMMFPQLLRRDRAATAKDVEDVAKSSEQRDAEREQREIERNERLEKRLERAELNVEIMSAFIVYDEDYHLQVALAAKAKNGLPPVSERMNFHQFDRRYRKDWFIERLDQVITKQETEEGGHHG